MEVIEAIELAIADHKANGHALTDYEFVDALNLAIEIIKEARNQEREG